MEGAHGKKIYMENVCIKEGSTTTLLQWKSWNAIEKQTPPHEGQKSRTNHQIQGL